MRESHRHRIGRYAIVLAIIATVGGLYVQREYFADGDSLAASAAGGQAAPLEIGRPAPDFELPARTGTVRLSALAGRAVLVNFWATWCGPCRFEMPELQAAHDAHIDRGDFVVLAVNLTSADSRSAAEAFIDELALTFPVAFDLTGEVAQRYGVLGLPASFFVDAEGIVQARVYGPLGGELLTNGLAAAGVATP